MMMSQTVYVLEYARDIDLDYLPRSPHSREYIQVTVYGILLPINMCDGRTSCPW